MSDQPEPSDEYAPMFADAESLSAALQMLHPELSEDERDEAVQEMLDGGMGAQQVGLLSLLKILQSFVCPEDQFEGFEEFANLPAEEAESNKTLAFFQKIAAAGITKDEITHFVRTVQFNLLDEVCLALDNNVNYDHVPYSEFGVYVLNTHTNLPEAHIDGLHECVDGIREEMGHED